MNLSESLHTVQLESPHYRMANHGGAWEIGLLALGLGLLIYGMVPMVRRWRGAPRRAGLASILLAPSWTLIMGIAVVGAFVVVVNI